MASIPGSFIWIRSLLSQPQLLRRVRQITTLPDVILRDFSPEEPALCEVEGIWRAGRNSGRLHIRYTPMLRKLSMTPKALNWNSMGSPNPADHPVKTISLLGIPFDANSSYLRGPAQAPKIIRDELYSGSSNLWTEDGIDLGRQGSFHDAGDVAIPDDDGAAFAAIESAVRSNSRNWVIR